MIAAWERGHWLRRGFWFLLLAILIFTPPSGPETGIDPSWRLALDHFFEAGRRFGVEVVFTYGPLGFLLANTDSGAHWGVLIGWQVVQAVSFSGLIVWQAERLPALSRGLFLVFFALFGSADAATLHLLVVVLVGLELIRSERRPRSLIPLLAALAWLSLFKFTSLLLATTLVTIATVNAAWRGAIRTAWSLPVAFLSCLAGAWALVGQRLLDLPTYLLRSWEVSRGYNEAMGLVAPRHVLWMGLGTLALLVTSVLHHAWRHRQRPGAVALATGLGAFILLIWKHGFVRADGHMLIFFWSALMVTTGFRALLDPTQRLGRTQAALLTLATLVSLAAADQVVPGSVRSVLTEAQHRLRARFDAATSWNEWHRGDESRLARRLALHDLPAIRALVGDASLDQLGHDQSVTLLNGFHYRARPVFQSYSAYTPRLAELNVDFFKSEQAPEFVLFRLEPLDGRLPTLEDSLVLRMLRYQYSYVRSEKGFHLWRRKPGATAPEVARPLRTARLPVGRMLALGNLAEHDLWATLDLRLTPLGHLVSAFYRPPIVGLRVRVRNRAEYRFRMPLPMARTGFLLNPLVDDSDSYILAAGAGPRRLVAAFGVEVLASARALLAPAATVSLSALPRSNAGAGFESNPYPFEMFDRAPVSFQSSIAPAEMWVDEERLVHLHAPSVLSLQIPVGARLASGGFGFATGAYTGDGHTDGAEFLVVWNGGLEPEVLFRRQLDPVARPEDRGLQHFRVELPGPGLLELRIATGPDGRWDWTGWTAVALK